MLEKRILVGGDPASADLIQAGPFLFTGGCDGDVDLATGKLVPELAAQAEAQCENSYGKVQELLGKAGAPMSSIVRLDHFTSSQDWLPRRQTVRGRIFGRPAPLASTGVAAKMWGVNMVTTSVIAVADPSQKKVLVEGPTYGMGNISAGVLGGPFVFVSGVRGTDYSKTRNVPEETPEAMGAQLGVVYETIGRILADCGTSAQQIVRMDCFLRDPARGAEDAQVRRRVLGNVDMTATEMALPLGLRGDAEITTLALAGGQPAKEVCSRAADGQATAIRGGGFVFVGQCLGAVDEASGREKRDLAGETDRQVENALDTLEKRLSAASSSMDRLVRLEVYLRRIYYRPRLLEILKGRFGGKPPVLFITGSEPAGISEVSLTAIAI